MKQRKGNIRKRSVSKCLLRVFSEACCILSADINLWQELISGYKKSHSILGAIPILFGVKISKQGATFKTDNLTMLCSIKATNLSKYSYESTKHEEGKFYFVKVVNTQREVELLILSVEMIKSAFQPTKSMLTNTFNKISLMI